MEQYRGTTILSVRRNGRVVIGGDGQVSLGNTVMKGNARKVRRLYRDKVIAGFAPPLSWPRTGALTAPCAASRPCWRWQTPTPP